MNKNLLTIIVAGLLFSSTFSFAQINLKETSLKQQINNSSLVIEGKVISKSSFWGDKFIYTANTIEVYKVFKGEASSTIEVITLGGTVGLEALIVSSSLNISNGDVGIFALENTSTTSDYSKSNSSKYKPYGAIQGFYKYNVLDDIAVNPFNVKKGISDTFYDEIMSYTKTRFIEISDFNIKAIQSKSAQSKNALAPSAITFSPTTITAGTKSTITITIPGGNTGTNFGSTKGKVAFKNADDGGVTFIDALNTQVTWSSNSITVEVPSHAGTGTIRVTNADSSPRVSVTNLTITSAETNVIHDEDDQTATGGSNGPLEPKAYQVQHIGENGNGGYTWQMQTDFFNDIEFPGAKASFLRAFDTWRTTSKINWTLGATTLVDVAVFESKPVASPGTSAQSVNVIRFENADELDSDVLGQTYSWYKGCSLGGGNFAWFVAEMDIVFDNDPLIWNFGPGATGFAFDFESVALHELGHGHQLAHVIDNSAQVRNGNDVMNFDLAIGEDQRVLAASNKTAASIIQTRSTTISVCGQPLMEGYSLGVEEDTLNSGIKIYPNPTNGDLFISNDGMVHLKKVVIYDISGRLISQEDISNAPRLITIRLNRVSKGIYFVNIHSDKTFITKKIILE